MKPTNPPSHKAAAGGHHHHSPEEMHNDDVAHEHSDINISALVWSMVVMFGVVVGTAVLMCCCFFDFLERAGRGQGSEAVAARDAGDDDAADDNGVAVFRRRAGSEADDRRADAPQGSRGPRSRSSCTATAGWTRRPASRASRSTKPRS